MPRARAASERFWEKVQKGEGCWLWMAARNHDGYGLFFPSRGRGTPASRFAWQDANGPIPDGMGVLHSCDNPPCVNPAHLFLGDQRSNLADCVGKGRHINKQKTHCPHGHLYDAANTIWRQRGSANPERHCRACKIARDRKRHQPPLTHPAVQG